MKTTEQEGIDLEDFEYVEDENGDGMFYKVNKGDK